jgi:hypothetical protein
MKRDRAGDRKGAVYFASVGKWVVEACYQDLSYRTSMVDLFRSYYNWCLHSRIAPLTKVALGRELSRRKFLVLRSSSGSVRWGLGLKENPEWSLPPPVTAPVVYFGTTADLLRRLIENNFSLNWIAAVRAEVEP